ncbi:MAG: NAD(P)/FAD-dependent oxidoreductase [Clostridia bacterium]|nr:NAD(P)/FAD-dependent oxidoreductase [Clostridia bacterium]
MYDVAIIGSGPAGISAAVNLKILGKNFIWFSSRASSKKVERAELVKNYLGLPNVTGGELAWTFQNHFEGMNIKLNEKLVTGVYQTEGHFTLLAENENYLSKSVILCTGVQAEKQLDGEEEFLGRGVSYCATCDGFLYKDKKIAILITDKKFEHEAEYLCGLSDKAYVMPMYNGYEINSPKAEIVLKNPVKVSGGMKADKVVFKDCEIDVDGLFILRGSVSPSTLVHGLQSNDGHILVNRDLSTNIKGLFAAGDCTGRPYQYAKSVGEGNVAAHSAVEYLASLK